MTLSLTPEIQKRIEERVRSGQYPSPEEVVAAAIESLDQQERLGLLEPREMEALDPGLNVQVDEGLAAAREGRLSDGERFFDDLDREESEADTATRSD